MRLPLSSIGLVAIVLLLGACASPSRNEQPVGPPFSAGDVHLFLLVGQSNMAGRGDPTPADAVTDPRILALNAAGEWVPAMDPIHWDKPIAGVGLARAFARAYLADHPGVTVGLIPAACGGSPISVWVPGAYFEPTASHPYDDALRRTRRALAHGTLEGILWHQGESDSHPELAEAYRDRLIGLIARFRRDLRAEGVPFILGQLGQFSGAPWGEHTRMVDAATRAVAESVPRCGFVSSDGLTSKADNLHFDTASLHEFGRRYYEEYARVELLSILR